MREQKLVVIPIAVAAARRLPFDRISLIPGVSLQKAEGPISRSIAEWRRGCHARAAKEQEFRAPPTPAFTATHFITIDATKYLAALDRRLQTKLTPTKNQDNADDLIRSARLGITGIVRQVLMALSLTNHYGWHVGENYQFVRIPVRPYYRLVGVGYIPNESTSTLFQTHSIAQPHDSDPANLRRVCRQLDLYYRGDHWHVDRFSVALGHLWSALTTPRPDLAFAALCMTLEAILSTSPNEITHTLAERCAIVTEHRGSERLRIFKDVKKLYGIRSTIVHGKSQPPKKGPITTKNPLITAKMSIIPPDELLTLLGITIRLINNVLTNRNLLLIMQKDQSSEETNKEINDYFLELLFT